MAFRAARQSFLESIFGTLAHFWAGDGCSRLNFLATCARPCGVAPFRKTMMDLSDAIARHLRARLAMDDYRNAKISSDAAVFSELNEENVASLNAIVEAPEPEADVFLCKLNYLTAFYAAQQRCEPALWQVNGALLLALWRRFGWSGEHWPTWEAGAHYS